MKGKRDVIVLFSGICATLLCFRTFRNPNAVCEKSNEDIANKIRSDAVRRAEERASKHALIRNRLRIRKEAVANACSERGLNTTLSAESVYLSNPYLKKSLFYSDKRKILMCLIPKCATRSQAEFLAKIEGNMPLEANGSPYEIVEKYQSPRNLPNIESIARRIRDYTKIVIAREPFSRLLSAFRDKIEKGGTSDNYKRIAARVADLKSTKNETEKNTMFTYFVEYLTKSKGDVQIDPHWNYYHRLCSPCEINYDYVIHMDTVEEDMLHLADKFGINNVTFPPSFNSFTDFTKVIQYYKEVPPQSVNELYHKYKTDFDLFGFSPPPQF